VLTPIWTIEPQTYADAKLALPFYLQREGQLVGEEHLRNFDLLSYTLGDQPAFDAIGNQVMLDQAFSEDVTLVEARWGAAYPNPDRNSPMTSAGTPFWVVLTWRVDHPLTGLRASVDLVDPAGRRLNHADQQLVRVQPETEDTPLRWAPQTLVRSYHLVDVPAAQLPGPVTLDARLYDSETLEPVLPAGSAATARGSIVLGQAVVGAPAGPSSGAAAPLARTVNAPLPDGLTLLGLDEWPATVQPGSPLTLRLVWQAAQPLAAEQVFVVALDSTHVTATLRLPVDMPVGYPMQTYADLRVSPDVTPGAYELLLNRVGGEEQPVKLGEVEINGRPRRFDVPVLQQPMQATFGDQVALLGIDTTAPVEVAPGQPFTITLAWQAQKTPRQDLVRFVHLLDPEGVLMAQRDGSPCGGECPTSSWLPGEVLVEDVRVQAPVGLAPESYRLAVGWYDAATLQRLAVLDENGQPMADNLLILPTRVEIKPQAPR
jgi:hypothetical protein